MMPWIWLSVIVAIILIEGVTMGLVSIWFLPGALIALVLSAFHVPPPWQIAVFVVMAVVMLFLGKRLFRPFHKKVKTNAEALIGQTAIVTEQVCNVEGRGAAKLRGQIWSARTEREGEALEIGEQVTVVAIEGVKLICRRKTL